MTVRSCDQVDCDRPVYAKGECQKHYQAAWHAENRERLAAQAAAYYAENREQIAATGVAYRAANPGQIAARKAAYAAENREQIAARNAAWYAENREQVAASSAARRARYPERAAAVHAAYRAKNPERVAATQAAWLASANGKAVHRAISARRRACQVGATIGEPFTFTDVFDRDGWVCGLCREPVDRDLAWPDPGSASLDHVIPLAKGGAHSEANAQLAHLVCNLSKGSRLTA